MKPIIAALVFSFVSAAVAVPAALACGGYDVTVAPALFDAVELNVQAPWITPPLSFVLALLHLGGRARHGDERVCERRLSRVGFNSIRRGESLKTHTRMFENTHEENAQHTSRASASCAN